MVAFSIIVLMAFLGCVLVPLKIVDDSTEELSYEQLQQRKRLYKAISKSSFLKR